MSFSLIPNDPSGSVSPKITKVLAWILGLGSAVVISPIIFLAVKGIVGLALAGLVGLTSLRLAPWVSMKLSNLGLKLIRYEARINPIETMMNVYTERSEAVRTAEVQIKNFNGQVNAYEQQVVELAKKYPEEAQRFKDHLQAMKDLLGRRYDALGQAKTGLSRYYEGIQRASAIWEMTKASDAISKSANLLSEKDATQRIRSDEALKSVEDSMARSFADLDHLLRTELSSPGQTPALSAPQEPVMLVSPINSKVYVPVDK